MILVLKLVVYLIEVYETILMPEHLILRTDHDILHHSKLY